MKCTKCKSAEQGIGLDGLCSSCYVRSFHTSPARSITPITIARKSGDLLKTLWTVSYGLVAIVGVTAVLIEFNFAHMILLGICLAVAVPRETA